MGRGESGKGTCYLDDITGELCLSLFTNMAEGVIFQDETGKVTAVNPAAEKVLGFCKDELVGKEPCWRSFREDGVECSVWETPSFAALASKNEVRAQLLGVHNPKENEKHWLAVNAIPVVTGSSWGVLTTFEDITERVIEQKQLVRALRREKECSKAFQRALLPRKVSIDSRYRIAHVYLPQDETIEVGGDLYDVFPTLSGQTGIMIGDAAGKGLEPASAAAVGCNTARAFSYVTGSAGEALTQTNSVLCSLQPEEGFGSFVTMLLMILDPSTGRISFSSAGHLPPIIRRYNGKIDVLSSVHQPLGITPAINYTESVDRLYPGDKIILYTDGVTEARTDPTNLFEQEGLLRFLDQKGDLPPDKLLESLLFVLADWTDNHRYDDTAIVIMERI